MAKWLKVEASKPKKVKNLISPLFVNTLKQLYIEKDSKVIGKSIVELNLVNDFLILLVHRDNEYFKPTGSTILNENDMLLIQCKSEKRYKKVINDFF